jgi:hypothetical protein
MPAGICRGWVSIYHGQASGGQVRAIDAIAVGVAALKSDNIRSV